MISYCTSVGSSRNAGDVTSKSSGRISSMNVRSSSSVASRGSGAAVAVALATTSSMFTSGSLYGSWSRQRAFFEDEGGVGWGASADGCFAGVLCMGPGAVRSSR